ncbi:MAG: hypothetical protein J5997_12130 [Oscillospiraceae bacterium]|nr:hypothetical protein [Oscillospiraceae bacterium]
MKKFRTLSAIAAAALAVSMIPVSASAEDTYHAYIGVQSASFSFRNAWYEPSYGKGVTGDDGMVYFDQITGWDGPTAVSKGGVFTDAEITGDGTYTVSVTDFDFGSDESLNLLFVSTDIPLDSGVTISDVKVVMDGNTKYTFDEAYLSPDAKEYLEPMCINIWNDDLGKEEGLFGYVMPENSIELTFTVSGLGAASAEAEEEAPAEETEAPAEEAPAEEAPAAVEETTAPKTGNTAAGALLAVMGVAAAAAVVSKRK